jgi:Eukaryotic initiation factor 4E
MARPIIQVNDHVQHQLPERTTSITRKTLHQNLLVKLRPLPFQYHWTVWFDKHSDPLAGTTLTTSIEKPPQQQQQYSSRLTVLYEDVADIATFYRVYNNYPWDRIRLRDTVHIFRKGVQPVWEDPENMNGGCWTFRVPKVKGQEFFHEVVILIMANELQAAIESGKFFLLSSRSISTSFFSLSCLVTEK